MATVAIMVLSLMQKHVHVWYIQRARKSKASKPEQLTLQMQLKTATSALHADADASQPVWGVQDCLVIACVPDIELNECGQCGCVMLTCTLRGNIL